jgi:hypothetical protein
MSMANSFAEKRFQAYNDGDAFDANRSIPIRFFSKSKSPKFGNGF